MLGLRNQGFEFLLCAPFPNCILPIDFPTLQVLNTFCNCILKEKAHRVVVCEEGRNTNEDFFFFFNFFFLKACQRLKQRVAGEVERSECRFMLGRKRGATVYRI